MIIAVSGYDITFSVAAIAFLVLVILLIAHSQRYNPPKWATITKNCGDGLYRWREVSPVHEGGWEKGNREGNAWEANENLSVPVGKVIQLSYNDQYD